MTLRSERGVSLIEATIVLSVIMILTSATAPIASRTVERGRLTRARTDMVAIVTAMDAFIGDIGGHNGPKIDGSTNGPDSNEVELLVGDGDIPPENSSSTEWSAPVDVLGTIVTDFIENHIIRNRPFDLSGGGVAYSATAWRGAYINGPIDPDPWGNRYAINSIHLDGTATEQRIDTFVLTSGPDEQIDTAWSMDGAVAGDDDLIVILRRDDQLNDPVP